MPKLTDVAIRSLPVPAEGQKTFWDDLKGFGVRVSQGGSKTFILMHGPTRQRITIGRVGVVSLADARTEARRLLAERTLGKHTPMSISFADAQKRYLDECERKNKPRTVADYRRLLKRHFNYGQTKLIDITVRDISRRLDRLASTPSEQHHAYVTVRAFLSWAKGKHYLNELPLPSYRQTPNRRTRVLSEDELKVLFGHALDYPYPFGPIVSLLVLTGQRRGEIASLQWDWIDGDTITLPDTKNNRSHTFPIGPKAQEVIEALPRLSDTFLFPASRSHVRKNPTTHFNGWGKCKADFDKGIEIEPYRLHDVRRTYSTIHASIGTPIHVTEKLLNHVSGTISGVAAVYNRHTYLPEMRDAVEKYEDYLLTLLAG